MWPCCDFTSSDDDEHNTDTNFLLLFADIGIMPTLLDGLTDVDVLHIALGCRFALDIFAVSQHYSSALESSIPFLMILSSSYFERCSHSVVLFSSPANWLALCEFQLSRILCAFVSDNYFSHTFTHREARALRVPGFSVSICVHTQYAALPRFSLSLVLAIVNLCPQMEGHQNVSSSTGPPELNHSYYAGNSLSALHSSQQVHEDSVSTSVHSRASTQRLIDNTPSCSALGSQLPHGHTGSPVLAGSTRNVTGEAMPASFVEALTQLSFLEFVQRCNLLVAPSQSTQLPAQVSLIDVAVQTASPCEVSQDSSTQTSDQPGSSLSLDVAVQTIFRSVCSSSLDAAVQTPSYSSLSQDVSTQFGSRPASSFSVDASLQTSTHSAVQLDAATQLDNTEFLIGWIFSDSPLDRRHPLCQSPPSVLGSHVVPLPPPGLEQPVPSPEIASHLQSLTNVSSSSCPTQQPPVSTTHVGTHYVR